MKAAIRTARLLVLASLVFTVACVAGQKVDLTYTPEVAQSGGEQGTVTVTVEDRREFVVSGDKDPAYIGHFRAGFGNPWDVKTEGEIPLAELIQRDLTADLEALGFTVPAERTGRTLEITIQDWNFDSYTNVKFWYELQLRVTDEQGGVLHEATLKEDEIVIKGSAMVGPKYAFKREYPGIYESIIKKIARENEEIRSALRQ